MTLTMWRLGHISKVLDLLRLAGRLVDPTLPQNRFAYAHAPMAGRFLSQNRVALRGCS
jgi:hypothetical protein